MFSEAFPIMETRGGPNEKRERERKKKSAGAVQDTMVDLTPSTSSTQDEHGSKSVRMLGSPPTKHAAAPPEAS